MINKILVETNNSFSNVFITLNSFLKDKNTTFYYVDSFFGRVYNKLKNLKIVKLINPKIFKYSISTMPMYHSGLGRKNLLWIHDTLTFEEKFIHGEEKITLSNFNKNLKKNVKEAKYIITPTEFSKKKLIKYLDCHHDKIRVHPYQIDLTEYHEVINNSSFINQLRIKYNIHENDKHIIFVGSPHYRKNLKTSLLVLDEINKSYPNLKLLIISYPRKDIPSTLESYQKIEQSNQAFLFSKIPRKDIIGLLTLSDLLLNPTLEEGFGLPNIEAQICGTPVVSSNVSCIPEVLEDSALLTDPLNVKLITEACISIIEDENLRKDLVKKGFKNVQKYNDIERYNLMLELFD